MKFKAQDKQNQLIENITSLCVVRYALKSAIGMRVCSIESRSRTKRALEAILEARFSLDILLLSTNGTFSVASDGRESIYLLLLTKNTFFVWYHECVGQPCKQREVSNLWYTIVPF
jgi:rhamnogalacturonyl hydrolase YesR